MLRLFGRPGVRVATRRIAQQRIQFRGFINGSGDEESLFESGDKQEPEASGNARPRAKQNWVPNDNDRLWDHVNKLGDRVASLSRDLGDFKGDVHKSIGELARAMEKGFGAINMKFAELETKMEKNHEDLKAEIKPLVWQVRVLLGVARLVVMLLIKTYMEEHKIFSKTQADAMPQPVSGPAVVAQKVDQKK